MSILQAGKILRRSIADPDAAGPVELNKTAHKVRMIPYFDYSSYYLVHEFMKICPSAKPQGVGWLRDWRWHINELGTTTFIPYCLMIITDCTNRRSKYTLRSYTALQASFRGYSGTQGVLSYCARFGLVQCWDGWHSIFDFPRRSETLGRSIP